LQNSDAARRENEVLCRRSLCGPSFETRARALLRTRSEQAAPCQILMVRRREAPSRTMQAKTLSPSSLRTQGPIPRDIFCWKESRTASATNSSRWLWVPAFAGTTVSLWPEREHLTASGTKLQRVRGAESEKMCGCVSPNTGTRAGTYSAALFATCGRYCVAGCGALSLARPWPNSFSRKVPAA